MARDVHTLLTHSKAWIDPNLLQIVRKHTSDSGGKQPQPQSTKQESGATVDASNNSKPKKRTIDDPPTNSSLNDRKNRGKTTNQAIGQPAPRTTTDASGFKNASGSSIIQKTEVSSPPKSDTSVDDDSPDDDYKDDNAQFSSLHPHRIVLKRAGYVSDAEDSSSDSSDSS